MKLPWAVFAVRWYYWGSRTVEHRLIIRKRYRKNVYGPFTQASDNKIHYAVMDDALMLLRTYLKSGRLPK